jgi:hypothetical protein
MMLLGAGAPLGGAATILILAAETGFLQLRPPEVQADFRAAARPLRAGEPSLVSMGLGLKPRARFAVA